MLYLPEWEFPLQVLCASFGLPITNETMLVRVQRAFANGATLRFDQCVREDTKKAELEKRSGKLPTEG